MMKPLKAAVTDGGGIFYLGALLASLISSKRVAAVVGYVVALFGTLIALMLTDGIYGDLPGLHLDAPFPWPLLLYPQVS